MNWIKFINGALIQVYADGASNVLMSLGYKDEFTIAREERMKAKKEKLMLWLAENTCPRCKRVNKRCICGET